MVDYCPLGFPEESTFYRRRLNPARLRAGANVLAVELHQIDPFAADASFDMALIGNIPVSPPESRIRPPDNRMVIGMRRLIMRY